MSDIDRKELHRRIMILRDQAQAGKIHLAEHLAADVLESLTRVQLAPDGLVDPGTVDGTVRAMALMMAHFQDREEWKNAISLQQVQDAFFQAIDHQFGELFQIMKERHAEPHQIAGAYVQEDNLVQEVAQNLPEFFEQIQEFWKNIADPAWIHGEDQTGIKAIYGGSIFPSSGHNIASSCGLYVDTIILPDPLLRISRLVNHREPKRLVYDVLRFGLQILNYRSLALAEIDVPIVAFLPDKLNLEEGYSEFIHSIATDDCLKHVSVLFGRKFESIDELQEYVKQFEQPNDLVAALANPDRLLFDTEFTQSLDEQIRAYMQGEGKVFNPKKAGDIIIPNFIGRMSQANDLLRRSFELRGTPLIDAETSWKYFNWKLEYDADYTSSNDLTPLHVVRGLQSAARGEMQWLGNIPPEALIEMRQQGATEELREILSQGVFDIAASEPSNFFRTTEQIVNNIRGAFEQHQQNLTKLRNKTWKFAGIDVGTWVVIGTIEVAAALSGAPTFGLLAFAADQLIDVPKLKELPGKFQEIQKDKQTLKTSPVGLLFQQSRGKR
ncbi:MAG: hypothetical protein FWK04_31730 [Nostoc sp. GBBB01]|nr:hypothetical protein [Nostoc sp. GBBB01]